MKYSVLNLSVLFACLLLQLLPEATAHDDFLPPFLAENRVCTGVYSRDSVPGSYRDSVITVEPRKDSKGIATLVIYNFDDQHLLGRDLMPPVREYVCLGPAIMLELCEEKDRGKFLIDNSTTAIAPIKNEVINFSNVTFPFKIEYTVPVTGLYCFIAIAISESGQQAVFDVDIEVENGYGHLPAVAFPKLPFYGFTSLLYMLVFAAWMIKSYFHWKDILPIQKYISAVIGFLCIETGMQYFYWQYMNTYGEQSKALLGITSFLNAGRNSISFFLLLIVSLGYGVVKPSLGSIMRRCKALAVVHFLFGLIYAWSTLQTGKDTKEEPSAWLVLFCVIPLAATMSVFYIWTLTALTETTKHLELRKQDVKLQMYKKVWKLLIFGAVNLGLFFVVNSVFFSQRTTMSFIARFWRVRWFLQDGWLNLLYTICMLTICVLWRPTTNNQRYGLEQLASGPEDFDMDDILDNVAVDSMGGNLKKRDGAWSDDDNDFFALDDGEDSDNSDTEATDNEENTAATAAEADDKMH